MKRYKASYLPSLGSYLDENQIEWFNNGNDTIDIICHGDDDLFRIAHKYTVWAIENEII